MNLNTNTSVLDQFTKFATKRLNRYAKTHRGKLAIAGLTLAVAITLVRLPRYAAGGGIGDVVIAHLYVLALLLLVTAATRTVSVKTLVVFWLVGVWTVSLGLTLLKLAVLDLLNAPTLYALLHAPVEIGLLAVPIVLYYREVDRRAELPAGASDGLLMGFAVGAGVAFYVAATSGLTLGTGFRGPLGALAPTFHLYENLGVGESLVETVDRWAILQSGWGALVGLSVGLARQLRHRPFGRLLFGGGLLFAVVDHLAVNLFTKATFGRTPLDAVLLDGRLPMLILVAGVVAVVAVDYSALRAVRREYVEFPTVRALGPATILAAGRDAPASLLALDTYLRYCRGVHFAVHRASLGDVHPDVQGLVEELYDLSEAANVWTDPVRAEVVPPTKGPEPRSY